MSIQVTVAESAVLEALWRCGPLPPDVLLAEVKVRQPWADATVKTLLGRLMQKDAVKAEREAGQLRNRPLISRTEYVEGEVSALAQRLFEGDAARLGAFALEMARSLGRGDDLGEDGRRGDGRR